MMECLMCFENRVSDEECFEGRVGSKNGLAKKTG